MFKVSFFGWRHTLRMRNVRFAAFVFSFHFLIIIVKKLETNNESSGNKRKLSWQTNNEDVEYN